jgi:hypothetical protein
VRVAECACNPSGLYDIYCSTQELTIVDYFLPFWLPWLSGVELSPDIIINDTWCPRVVSDREFDPA